MSFTYDWNADRWANLPLGAKLSKLFRVSKVPVQFSFEYEHNFTEHTFDPANTLRLTIKCLFPT